jgi:hypothetical protein
MVDGFDLVYALRILDPLSGYRGMEQHYARDDCALGCVSNPRMPCGPIVTNERYAHSGITTSICTAFQGYIYPLTA